MFVTDAPGVVVADTNGRRDAFVRDVRSGRVRRVSLTASGSQIDGGTENAALSRDGRSVAFVALAAGVMPGGPQVSSTYGYVRGTRWALRR